MRSLLVLGLFLAPAALPAERLTFSTPQSWASWSMPSGLVRIDESGLGLVPFRREINAVADASRFTHATQGRGEAVPGGIWAAGSGPATAALAIDGQAQTWWQPDPSDPLKQWFLDIDLGRAVLARQIRLRFPDQEGARPFQQFTVYASTGARIRATEDIFKFDPVYRTTRPNRAAEIAIPLEYSAADTVILVDPGMQVDRERENRYQVVQYLSFVAEEQNPGAALAEVEVLAVGDNAALGTRQRGAFVNGTVAAAPDNLFDADMNTTNLITSGRGDQGWEAAGTWFYVDLGAVFFVDELFIYVVRPWEGTAGWHRGSAGSGHRILYSEGGRAIGTSLPVPESFDYSELLTHVEPRLEDLFRIRYLFRPRRMRYIFWHGLSDRGWQESKWAEWMLFSSGYPARVVLLSDFIDLARVGADPRPKVIKALHWDADLPPGTHLHLRSRSGNELSAEYTFYDRKGDVVTEAKWNSSPKVLRGQVDTAFVAGADWGGWSNVYSHSGEAFQSESPRRFAQLELILSTDDPQVAPSLRSLSLEYEQALLQRARGRIAPLQTRPNEETRFTYTLWPGADEGDSGFDRVRLSAPGPVSAVRVRLGGHPLEPLALRARADSLLLTLPAPVRADSLEIDFVARVVENATVFSMDLGLSQRPGLWQSVEPVFRRADIVLLPELARSQRLIGDLRISTPVLTPNGDGVHDQVEIRFVAFKVAAASPRLRLFDLAGRLLAEVGARADGAETVFTWDGRTSSGERVRPGLYLYHLDLGAESGKDSALRTLSVAY